jgi:hypothetical protein
LKCFFLLFVRTNRKLISLNGFPCCRTAYRYGYKEDPEGCRNEKYLPYTLEEEEELNRQVKAGELVRDNNCRPFKKIKITKDGVPVRVCIT